MSSDLTEKQKASIFDRFWHEYVATHGLGGMGKSDLDALILWSFAEALDNHDHFFLGQKFKVKESRIKSLLATGEVKFDDTFDAVAWQKVLNDLSKASFSVESIEKGQIRFHLGKQHYFRHIQRQARELNDSFEQKASSEYVIANLSTLYKILDNAWNADNFGKDWNGDVLIKARENIKHTIGNIGRAVEGNELEQLRNAKSSKLFKAIEQGSKLASIGSLIVGLYSTVRS
jgi:hypothetical protein